MADAITQTSQHDKQHIVDNIPNTHIQISSMTGFGLAAVNQALGSPTTAQLSHHMPGKIIYKGCIKRFTTTDRVGREASDTC
jgi:hypothetical protein